VRQRRAQRNSAPPAAHRENHGGQHLEAAKFAGPGQQVSHHQHPQRIHVRVSVPVEQMRPYPQQPRATGPHISKRARPGIQQAKHDLQASQQMLQSRLRTLPADAGLSILELGGGARRKRAKANGPCPKDRMRVA